MKKTAERETCAGCIYRRPISANVNQTICYYAIDTGGLRGCQPQECDKKVINERRPKKAATKKK